MTSRRAAVVAACLLLLIPTACGSTASGSAACAEGTEGTEGGCQDNGVVVADDDTPASDGEAVRLVATSPVDAAMEAATSGVVDVVDGCLGLRHDDGTSTVVSWHRGSELLDDPVGVRLPSGQELHVGDPLEAGGGRVTAGPEETRACPGAGEVWLLGDVTDDG